jgi:glycerol-3-phosphate dehydrogenase
MTTYNATVAIVGGGVVGTAILHTLAHRGVDAILLEAQTDLAYQASGTNSGVLHTGFDSTPGQLETDLILRSAALRASIVRALDIPVSYTGATLIPHEDGDDDVIRGLAENAARNGVEVSIRSHDGALLVPGESVTDPVAFTLALGASARSAGARIILDAAVTAIDASPDSMTVMVGDDHAVTAEVVINAAGLHADDVARLIGDDSFEIYPRKGEFFVFELPGGDTLGEILLPVPTKRTKGVLVFPTLDGRVVAGPTALDQVDKNDWSVRSDAQREVLEKAVVQYPKLAGLEPVASYAGLRTAGRDANYIIEHSVVDNRLINVAAIRSTGLTACLGIAAHVSDMLPALGVTVEELQPARPATAPAAGGVPWWRRTAEKAALRT